MIFELKKAAKQLLFNSKKLKSTDTQGAIEEVAESMIYGEVKTGECAKNAANSDLPEVTVYGKSTQAGEPTPDVPVDIVSVDKALVVKSCGKNELNISGISGTTTWRGITHTLNDDKSITLSGTATELIYIGLDYNTVLSVGESYTVSISKTAISGVQLAFGYFIADGTFKTLENGWVQTSKTITIPSDYVKNRIVLQILNGATVNATIYPMIRKASIEDDTYEPYISTQANLTLADDFRGIPVTEGGNYTDANGQQWICDTLEKYADGAGKLIQRIGSKVLTAADIWKVENTYVSAGASASAKIDYIVKNDIRQPMVISNKAIGVCYNDRAINIDIYRVYGATGNSNNIAFRYPASVGEITIEQARADFTGTEVIYALAEPIETVLDAKTLTELEKLQSFEPYTTVMTDDIADVRATYLVNSPAGKAMDNHIHDNRYYPTYHMDAILNNFATRAYVENTFAPQATTYTKLQTDDAIANGLNAQLKTKTYLASGGQGAANEVKTITVDVSLAGYTPLIGVVTSSLCIEAQVSIASNTATVTVRNGSDAGTLSATFTVLYTKINPIG